MPFSKAAAAKRRGVRFGTLSLLSDARMLLADLFSILLEAGNRREHYRAESVSIGTQNAHIEDRIALHIPTTMTELSKYR